MSVRWGSKHRCAQQQSVSNLFHDDLLFLVERMALGGQRLVSIRLPGEPAPATTELPPDVATLLDAKLPGERTVTDCRCSPLPHGREDLAAGADPLTSADGTDTLPLTAPPGPACISTF